MALDKVRSQLKEESECHHSAFVGITTLKKLKKNFPGANRKLQVLIDAICAVDAKRNGREYRSSVEDWVTRKAEYAVGAVEEYRTERGEEGDYANMPDDTFLLNILLHAMYGREKRSEILAVLETENVADLLEYVNANDDVAREIVKYRFDIGE